MLGMEPVASCELSTHEPHPSHLSALLPSLTFSPVELWCANLKSGIFSLFPFPLSLAVSWVIAFGRQNETCMVLITHYSRKKFDLVFLTSSVKFRDSIVM